jgi:hypothetical protein
LGVEEEHHTAMKDLFRPIPTLLVTAALITGCGTMQNTTAVRDDVYFMPS